ncbi:MAG: hypothetical protein KL787_05795 [Taibaiella sp.]|nr:hypothetical protein [Taibaiella sp.]
MKFQVGDPVVLKHTGSEGKITSAENNGMYLVLIDGVEIPVFRENLDHPYFDWFTKERDQKKKLKFVHAAQIPTEKETTRQKIVSGTFLGFFPEFDKNDDTLVQKFKTIPDQPGSAPLVLSIPPGASAKDNIPHTGSYTAFYQLLYPRYRYGADA